jgi:nickel-dependent lactate racemase
VAVTKVRVAYGDDGLDIEVDAAALTVVEPIFSAPAPDPSTALRRALRAPVAGPPLRDRIRPGQTVAIAACDITRPQPRRLMIPALLAELDGLVDLDDVTVIVATGTHRGSTEAELVELFGEDVVGSVRVVNHDSRDRASLSWQGVHGNRVPVWLARDWVDADVRITTGFVEPHFFAGFSGGPKLVAPGLAGLDTVLCLHDARRIGHPMARWGVIEGNPVHDDVRAIAAGTGVTFGFDVILNRDQEIVAAYGGDLLAMHERAVRHARQIAMRPVSGPFDVVVTSNSGYPLDQNLYQAVKGMSAAYQVARPGGMVICAAECRDGFPEHGGYRDLLVSAPSPRALLERIETRSATRPDQWQVQIQARIQADCRVVMHTSYLSDSDLAAAHLEQTADISDSVARALAKAAPGGRACVLPEGPQTVPYLV